jgi:hypothetical protein
MSLHNSRRVIRNFAERRCLVLRTAILLLAICTSASPALAVSLLFDQLPNSGGTLSYDGTGGPLIGTDIVFDSIVGVGTPLNSGAVLTLIDGRLNFTTGANLLEPPPVFGWGGGGSFVLTADAVLDNLLNDVIVPANDTPLLVGTFVGTPTLAAVGLVGGNQINISAFGFDNKHPDVLAYFGLTPELFQFAESTISTNDLILNPNLGFTATVAEADITNTAPPSIPEPSTFLLLAIAVAGLLLGRRRFFG